MADEVKVLIVERNGTELEFQEELDLKALNIPYDNTDSGLTAADVKAAIDEAVAGGGTGASPGFSFGRSGNVSSGAYLQNESVPSNVTGRPVDLVDARVTQVSISNENSNTFTVELEEHDGTTYTSLGTFAVTAARSAKYTGISISVTSGKEIAAKISSGSCKNPVVTVYVKGDAS